MWTLTVGVLWAFGCTKPSGPVQLDEAVIREAKSVMEQRTQQPVASDDPAVEQADAPPSGIEVIGRGGKGGVPPAAQ
jgi:hypothetical protein